MIRVPVSLRTLEGNGGPDDAEPLLGVVMLASLGFTVDPVTQTLKRLSLLPLKPLAA